MGAFDEDALFGAKRPKPPAHEIGQPLDDLSAPELAERIETLRQEIARLEERHQGARGHSERRERVLQELSPNAAFAEPSGVAFWRTRPADGAPTSEFANSPRRARRLVTSRLTIINYELIRPKFRVLNGSYPFCSMPPII